MKIKKIIVLPDTPQPLKKLKELAYNLYFSWTPEVGELFAYIDEKLWEECKKNPVVFLADVSQDVIHKVAEEKSFIANIDRVYHNYQIYMTSKSWYESKYGKEKKPKIAYFSCEFGIDRSVPIYSGGLGILSGDHIKTASDLGLPLVGVGLFYKNGYFEQDLDSSGNQIERYSVNNPYNIPIGTIKDEKGNPVVMTLYMAGQDVHFIVKRMTVGRIKVFLMDTNIPENPPEVQIITRALYDGDRELRLRQEYLLGIGGVKLLNELGYDIETFHVNEGHSVFLQLERIKNLMKNYKMDFESARICVRHGTCFTTHTPVPAGNEEFDISLITKYFKPFIEANKLNWELFLSLGRVNPGNHQEKFNLTVFALKLSGFSNGVSKLHGAVSREMWQDLYPKIPQNEVPIKYITNGVHGQTWTDEELVNLILKQNVKLDRYTSLFDEGFYKEVLDVDDQLLWEWKCRARKRLIMFLRKHYLNQNARQAGKLLSSKIDKVFNPECLTIGFARRFATYKRGDLFIRDIKRLKSIITNEQRPVQIVLAGKAHPEDNYGKEIIKSIIARVKENGLENHVVFLENYNIDMAKFLVSGVDIWLNNPIKPKEASGTSGMKAAMNGSLNLSIKDGWWDEAYNNEIGWQLDSLVDTKDRNSIDQLEAERFYDQLEHEITHVFYDRNGDNVPKTWVEMMKQSIYQVGANFNSIRMLKEYTNDMYLPSIKSTKLLKKNNYSVIGKLSEWKINLFREWQNVKIVKMEGGKGKISREESIDLTVEVELGKLTKDEVSVQAYYGILNDEEEIDNGTIKEMKPSKKNGSTQSFSLNIPLKYGGMFGYTSRVIPKHDYLINPLNLGLVHWSDLDN